MIREAECSSLEADEPICRAAAGNVPSIIASVDYSLTPENEFHKQLEGTLSICRWFRENALSFGGD